jgi:hypothetical protein
MAHPWRSRLELEPTDLPGKGGDAQAGPRLRSSLRRLDAAPAGENPFEASGQAKERRGWRSVLSWIRAA